MFIQAPLCKNEKLGKKFCSLLFSMLLLLTTVVAVTIQSPAMAEATTTVQPGKYLDHVVENSQATLQEKDIPGDAVHISSSSMPTTWVDGKTYVVAAGEGGTVTVAGTRITVNGTVNLILTNRTTLHIPKGIGLADNAVLNIFAQSDDPDDAGKLVIDGVDSGNAGIGTSANWNPGAGVGITVNIHGGVINAAGGRERYGVFGAGAGAGVGSGAGAAGAVNVGVFGGVLNAAGSDTDFIAGAGAGVGSGVAADGAVNVSVFGGVLNAAGGKLDNGFSGAGVGSGAGAGGAVNVGVFGGALNAAGGQGYHSGAGIGSGTAASHATTVFKDGVIFINGWDPSWQNGDSSEGNATNKATVFVGSFDGEQIFELHDDSSLNKDAVLPATIKRLTGFNGVTPVWVTTSPTYKIPAGKTLTVPEGKHLDVQGKLQNAGTIVNQGEIFAPNYTEENGTVQKRNTIGAASVTRAGDTLTFNSGSWAGTSEKGDGVEYCFRQYGASSWDCVNNPIRRLPSVGGFYQTKMQYASDLTFYESAICSPVQSSVGDSYLNKTYNRETYAVETTVASMETYESISDGTTTWSGTAVGGVGTFYMPVPAEGSSVVEIPDSRVSVSGKVNLVLPDGVTLHIPKGIGLEDNATLNIFAQSDDPDVAGKLVIDGVADVDAGIGTNAGWNPGSYVRITVNIHGGVISATGGQSNYPSGAGAGVGSGAGAGGAVSTIVYGGVINATGGDGSYSGAGVGSGANAGGAVSTTVYGGVINATGGRAKFDSGAGVGSGANAGGAVSTTVYGGVISATGGQADFASGAGVGSGAGASGAVSTTVYGGVINATGGVGHASGAGVGSGAGASGAVFTTVYGGVISATGGQSNSPSGAGVGSGAGAYGAVSTTVYGGVINATGGVGGASGAGVGSGPNADGDVKTIFKDGVIFTNVNSGWQNGDTPEGNPTNKATVFVGSFDEGTQEFKLHEDSSLNKDVVLPASIKLLTGMSSTGVPTWSETTPKYQIPEDKTLTVPSGKTLDVNGRDLAIAGVLNVAGTLAGISGLITNTGDVVISGDYNYAGTVIPREIIPQVSTDSSADNKAKLAPHEGLPATHVYEYKQDSNDWKTDSVFDHNIGDSKSYQIRVATRDKAHRFFSAGNAVSYTVGVNVPNVSFEPTTEKLTGFVADSTYKYRIVEAGHENSGPEPGWENLSFDPGSGIAALPSNVLERIKTGVVQLELKRIVNGQASVAHSVVVPQRLMAPVVSVDGATNSFKLEAPAGSVIKYTIGADPSAASCKDARSWSSKTVPEDAGFVLVAASGGKTIYACVAAIADRAGSEVTHVAATAQSVPAFAIDYAAETFSATLGSDIFDPGQLEYSTNDGSSWDDVSSWNLVDLRWNGSTKDVLVRRKGAGTTVASASVPLHIAARPDAPAITKDFANSQVKLPKDTKYAFIAADNGSKPGAADTCNWFNATHSGVEVKTADSADYVVSLSGQVGKRLYACLPAVASTSFASEFATMLVQQQNAPEYEVDYVREQITVTTSGAQYQKDGVWHPVTDGVLSFTDAGWSGTALGVRLRMPADGDKIPAETTVSLFARPLNPAVSVDGVNSKFVIPAGSTYKKLSAGSATPASCADLTGETSVDEARVDAAAGEKIVACIKATNSAPASLVTDLTAEAQPQIASFTIDYADETFSAKDSSSGNYSADKLEYFDGSGWQSVSGLSLNGMGWTGSAKDVQLRVKGTATSGVESGKIPSEAKTLNIDARPDAPSVTEAFADGGYKLPVGTNYVVKGEEDGSLATARCSVDVATKTVVNANDVITVKAGQHLYACALGNNTLKVFASRYSSVSPSQFPAVTVTPDYANETFTVTGGESAVWRDLQYRTSGSDAWQDAPGANSFASFGLSDSNGLSLFFRRKGGTKLASDSTSVVKVTERSTPTNSLSLVNENVVVAEGQKYLKVAAGSSNTDVPATCKDVPAGWVTAAVDTTVSLQPGDKLLVCNPATATAVASKVATITAPQRQGQPVATLKYAMDGFILPKDVRYTTTDPAEESLCSALTSVSDGSSVIKAYELWACTPAGGGKYASEIKHVTGAQQQQPEPAVDFASEKLTGVAGTQWASSTDGAGWNDLLDDEVALTNLDWNGAAATVWVRTKYSDADDSGMFASAPVKVSLKARPATPQIAANSVINASFADTADGKFTLPAGDTGTDAGSASPTFTVRCAIANDCGGFTTRIGVAAGSLVENLPVGSYQVVQEATAASFASAAARVEIKNNEDRIWTVEPSGEIDFGASDYGVAVVGQNIVVTNHGNSAIQVTGVAVSGTDAGAFELSEVSPLPKVAANTANVKVATVTPVATADAQDNEYQATVTITYNELPVATNAGRANETVTVTVKRKVNKAAQNNPRQLDGPTVVTDVAAEFTALRSGLGDAAALYKLVTGSDTAVPAVGGAGWVSAAEFAELTANTDYEVWAYYPAVTNYQQTNPVKVGSFRTLRAAPNVSVDADTEAFVGADTSMEYRQPETDKWTAVPENMTLASLDRSVWDGSAGVALEFRYKAEAGLAAGVAQTVQVSSRQPQPAVTVVQQPSFADTADGQIKLPGGSGDRFTVDGTGDYPGGSLVAGLGVGDHTVVQKAAGGLYKSQPQVVTLTAQGARNWQVDADEPAIADLIYGVEPQDLNVVLRNVGNSPVRIIGVASSNEQVVSAQLAGGTEQQILAPGASVADAIVISPAAGLDANSYAGEVTVSWQPVVGETAAPGQQAQETKIPVSFTVVKAAQAAPAAAPVEVAQVTATTVQLRLVQFEQAQLEYGLVPAGSSPDRWQQGLEFSGLTPATKYEIFVRVAGDNNHQASAVVSGGVVTTAAAAVSDEEVLAPDVVDYGSGEIKDAGLEFATSKDFAPDTILPAGTDLKDLAGQTVFVRVKADPETGAGASAPVEIKVPKVQDVPQLEVVDGQLVARTGTGVETGRLEYRAAGATGAEGAWQPLPADGKLPAGNFEVRFAGSPTAGFASKPVTVAVATTIDQVQVQQVGDISIRVTPVAADPITGAPAEYSVDGGHTWQTDPVFTGLEPEHKYTVAVRYQGQKMTPVTVEAQTTVAAPKQVDFFAPASEVEFATREDFAADAVLPAGADLALYAGQTIYVRAKENPGSGAAASPVVAVKVPQRAMTPQLQVAPWGISGLDPSTAYEYQAEGEQDWTAIALGTTELPLAPGTYLVRAAANSAAGLFASLPQTVVITGAVEDDEVVKADSPLQVVKSMSFGFLAVIAGMLAVIALPSFLFYVFATGQLPAESSGLPIAGLGRM